MASWFKVEPGHPARISGGHLVTEFAPLCQQREAAVRTQRPCSELPGVKGGCAPPAHQRYAVSALATLLPSQRLTRPAAIGQLTDEIRGPASSYAAAIRCPNPTRPGPDPGVVAGNLTVEACRIDATETVCDHQRSSPRTRAQGRGNGWLLVGSGIRAHIADSPGQCLRRIQHNGHWALDYRTGIAAGIWPCR